MAYNLGKNIKYLREKNNLSQKEFAKILNISNSALSQYESNVRVPSDDIKIKIADYFNVSLDYLLGRPNTHNTSKEKYISGFEALNVVSEDGITIADWHPLKYWVYSKQSPEISLYSYNPLLGMSGIKERIIDYKPNQKVFIADFPRAIADYIFMQPKKFAKEMFDCRKDFLSTKKEEEEGKVTKVL